MITNEEINKIYLELANSKWNWQVDFARAILKKAQESSIEGKGRIG